MLAAVDHHTPILRFSDTRSGRDQRVVITFALRRQASREAEVTHHFRGRLSLSFGQIQRICGRPRGSISVAGDKAMPTLVGLYHLGKDFLSHLRNSSAVEIEKDDEGPDSGWQWLRRALGLGGITCSRRRSRKGFQA